MDRARESHSKTQTVLDALPDDLEFTRAHHHCAYAAGMVHIDPGEDWREGVRRLLERFPPVRTVRYKDSFSAMRPEASLTDRERLAVDEGRASDVNAGPGFWVALEPHFTAGGSFPETPEVSVRWFAEMPNGLCLMIRADLSEKAARETEARYHKVEERTHPTIASAKRFVRWDYRAGRIRAGETTRYAGGDPKTPPHVELWWPYGYTDDGNAAKAWENVILPPSAD